MPKIIKKRITIILTGLLSLVLAILIMIFGLFFIRPAEEHGSEKVIIVSEGAALRDVAENLYDSGVITNPALFILWAKLMDYSSKIKAGEFRLSPAMPPMKVMEILTRGQVITHPVTIPEGFSLVQIAEILNRHGLAEKSAFLTAAHSREVLNKHGISGPSLEGYLYPDTYQFAKGLSPESIIATMIKRFKEVLEPQKEMIERLGIPIEEVITLASIVEKETGKAEERPLIASVFLNRIKRRMRIESDPTVIYGIKNFNGNLTLKDLSTPTPYNTYIIEGLPPGPIANPGKESILAVLNPADTRYLYFVSKNDGSHHFSETLKEHNRAVQIYQRKRSVKADKPT